MTASDPEDPTHAPADPATEAPTEAPADPATEAPPEAAARAAADAATDAPAEPALAARFEGLRGHLRGVAYRMLGSLSEADDAVQEAWIRLSRADAREVANLGGWLTTVVSRVCLDLLRARKARREDPVGSRLPDPIVRRAEAIDPTGEAALADSVSLALLVVLETLAPAERLAFVLHDLFDLPFDQIAPIVGRTPTAARQLASRARRRVQGAPAPDADLAGQRAVVDAFLAAVRAGDFDALVAVLDPDVVRVADAGAASGGARVTRGARKIARGAVGAGPSSQLADHARPALVNGAPGLVVAPGGVLRSIVGFTVVGGKIVEIHVLADPARLAQIDLASLAP